MVLEKLKKYFPLAVLFFCGVAGCFILYKKNIHTQSLTATTPETLTEEALPIRAVTVTKKNLQRTFPVYTALLPWREAVIKPNAQGLIQETFVSVGQQVKKDQKLFTMNSEAQKLKAELDQIDFQLRGLDYNVAMALAKSNFLSKKEKVQKQLEYQASRIRAKLSDLDNSGSFRSPMNGIVSEANLRAGDFVDNNSNSLVRIVDLSQIKTTFWIPQSIAKQINLESEVSIHLDEQKTFGQIQAISPTVDQKTGSVLVEVEVKKPPKEWRVGQFVQIKIVLEEQKDVLVLPKKAIHQENGKYFVYKIQDQDLNRKLASDNQVVRKTNVELGLSIDETVAIKKGLEEFDVVSAEGSAGLSDGKAIEIFSND